MIATWLFRRFGTRFRDLIHRVYRYGKLSQLVQYRQEAADHADAIPLADV
jgi:hypothetical protein